MLRNLTTLRPAQSVARATRQIVPLQVETLEARVLLTGLPPGIGYYPFQLQHAYGFDEVTFQGGAVKGDGTGQTIAIVAPYDDPNIQSDLHVFDQTLGIPDPPSFVKLAQDGSTNYPTTDPTGFAEAEEANFVEWAHALAQGAKIILVEANDTQTANLFNAAVPTAAAQPGVSVVVFPFGTLEASVETSLDGLFVTPAGHTPETFISATGDAGFGQGQYPAFSPNVLAVGATEITLNSGNNIQSEPGWHLSGGGLSAFEAQPAYQKGVVTQSTTQRSIPDVAFAGGFDDNLGQSDGMAIYNSFPLQGFQPWQEDGGTEAGAVAWASIIAIADQGRALQSLPALDGVKDTLPKLYGLPQTDFHDITTGNNGSPAGPGYDLVTGRGTPIVNFIVPGLVGGSNLPPNIGYYPSQIQHAYGFDKVTFQGGAVAGDGTGQTIAIVDPYDDPHLASDLHTFDQAFGIPDPPSFQKLAQDGSTNYPPQDPTGFAEAEMSADVEWAHALAPGANIIVVEANDNQIANLFDVALPTAASQPGVSVVAFPTADPESSVETNLDSLFTTPAGHTPETFVAPTGESGFGQGGYPAFSPNVLAVGATVVQLNSQNAIQTESAWQLTGGGISIAEPQPAYQKGVVTQSTTDRTIPDVSFAGGFDDSQGLITGMASYDSLPLEGIPGGWYENGTTGIASIAWSAIIAIADQGRALAGLPALDGVNDTQPLIYKLPSADFHDITTGSNGSPAGPGYDLATGIGTPIVNLVVPGLLNIPTSTIAGVAFNDLNGNGKLDAGDPGISGRTIYIDLNNSGTLQSNDPTATSDASGKFTLPGLADGTYIVREVLPGGWVGTTTAPMITVKNGQVVSNVDVGSFQLVDIGGEVFSDLNGNGIKDTADPGLQGWTVQLLNSAGTVVTTATTDANGNYTLAGVGPGSFTIKEVLKPGALQTAPASPGTFSLSTSSGTNESGDDFGDFIPVSLGGEVFNDINGSGAKVTSDSGLQGWTVELLNQTGALLASTTTDGNGHYTFAGVGPGTFTIEEVRQGGWTQTFPSASGTHTVTVGTDNGVSLDFGNFQLATLIGQAFNDLNGNGAKDAGDTGLSGWTIQLLNGAGGIVQTAVTDANGNYIFTSIGPGTFAIKEVLQSGWFLTTPGAGGMYSVTTASGQVVANENFGDFQSATISGEVFNDLSGSGSISGGDPGLRNWTIQLFNAGGNLVTSTFTDANGNYSLTGVGPGTYTVSEVAQAGWLQTFPATPGSQSVTTSSGQIAANQNFGNFQAASIRGEVFVDQNGDGILAGADTGRQGWTIQLVNPGTGVVLATQTTNANGDYSFTVLPGTYRLRELGQAGWEQTTTNPSDITVSSGGTTTGVNFGNFQLAVIAGTTFQDFNGNGLLDGNDTGLPGWTVQIVDPVSGAILNSQISGGGGDYSMVAGGPGTYLVREVAQSGWLQTTNSITIIVTTSGTIASGENFGSFRFASISGLVFVDNNGNGIQDGADAGAPGWTVQLLNSSSGTVVASQLTDANGAYTFTNLGPGTFGVRDVLQPGSIQTSPNPGDVSTSSGGSTFGVSFGVFQLAAIRGTVFSDKNGDGVLGNGDGGLTGWGVQLLNARNGSLLQSQTTDGQGNYQFGNLGPGTYLVREILPAGWVQTSTNSTDVTVSSGTTSNGGIFGNFQLISLSGRVFMDLTADGVDSPAKPGFNGFTIELYRDVAGTGQLIPGADPVVASTVSGVAGGQAGQFSFNGIGPGKYIVGEVAQTGRRQTAPTPLGAYSVVALSGGNLISLDFGNLASSNQSFIYQVYLDLLHRQVDPSGMPFWSGELDQGVSRAQVVQSIENSLEYRTDQVEDLYQSYLGRSADPSGLASSLNLLLTASSYLPSQVLYLQLQANILGSAEYYQNRSGGTNSGFLSALYQDVLGRSIDPSGAIAFGAALANGMSRTLVAKAVLSSVEADQRIVETDYMNYLQRQADPLGMDAWVNLLQQGGGTDTVTAAVIGSDEYFSRV